MIKLSGLATMAAAVSDTGSSDQTNFLLVTSTSDSRTTDSSKLPDVSAISLFDPNHQPDYLLRLINPGYNSLPQFNLSSSGLQTEAYSFAKLVELNSISVRPDTQLVFRSGSQDHSPDSGRLSLLDGYLLAVDGESKGWTFCDGPQGEKVVRSAFASVLRDITQATC